MGLFSRLFGGSKKTKEQKILPWKRLTTVHQLNIIAKLSKTKTQVVFKHSTRCGISKMVMNQFISSFNLDNNLDLYYLDLLSYREVSDELGYKFQILHQSPQIIIIKNNVVIAHASHGAINQLGLERFV